MVLTSNVTPGFALSICTVTGSLSGLTLPALETCRFLCNALYGDPRIRQYLHSVVAVLIRGQSRAIDPAVGNGSLLLKFAKILGKENVRNGFFGQEINITTYNLCRINQY